MSEKETNPKSPDQSTRKESLWSKFRGFLDDMSVVESIPLNEDEIYADALSKAQGINKITLKLAEQTRKAASAQNIGTFSQQFDNSDRKRLHPTNNWLVPLKSNQDNERGGLAVEALPSILLQDEELKVNSVNITVSSGDNGVSSVIWLNNTVGLVNLNNEYNDRPVFGSGVKIEINADGTLNFGRESDKLSGFTDVSYTEHNITSFIEQLQALPELT